MPSIEEASAAVEVQFGSRPSSPPIWPVTSLVQPCSMRTLNIGLAPGEATHAPTTVTYMLLFSYPDRTPLPVRRYCLLLRKHCGDSLGRTSGLKRSPHLGTAHAAIDRSYDLAGRARLAQTFYPRELV